MSIDWDTVEQTLYDFASSQLQQFAKDKGDERYYAFAFCCNAPYGEVMLSLNCESELQNPSYEIYAHDPPEKLEKRRWSIGDWRYMESELIADDESTVRWNACAEEIADLILNTDHDDDDDDSFMGAARSLENEFMRRACLVALRLEADGVLECLPREPHFTIYVVDHDETDFDSWKRLTKARIEFAPPWNNGPWPIQGRHPEMAASMFAIAAEYHHLGRQLEAAHLLREALARLPEFESNQEYPVEGTDVVLHIPVNEAFARAYCYRAEEAAWCDDEVLDESINTAISYDENFAEPYYLRARQLCGGPVPADQLDAAVTEVNRAIERNPNDARYFGLRAEIRARPYHPFYEQAADDYSRAIELEPRNEEWLTRRAELYVQLDRCSEAVDDFTRIFEIWNSHVSWKVRDALEGRAHCFEKLARFAEAVEDWTRLLGYNENPKYLHARARCYRALGDEAKATNDERQAKETNSASINLDDLRAQLKSRGSNSE